jgi:hypothetical protein
LSLRIAKHVQRDAVIEVLLSAHAINRLLPLAVPTVAPVHRVGGRREQFVSEKCQRLLQVGRAQFVHEFPDRLEAAHALAQSFKVEILSDLKIEQMLPLAERAVTSAERAVATVDCIAPAVDRLTPAVGRVLSVVEGAPKLLLGERETVIKVFQDELDRMFKLAREERIVALEYMTKERVAALNELRETLVVSYKMAPPFPSERAFGARFCIGLSFG